MEKMPSSDQFPTLPSVEDLERFRETEFFNNECQHKSHDVERTYKLQILPGRANPGLGFDICKILGLEPMPLEITQRENQEICFRGASGSEGQGNDVFVVQSTAENGSKNLDLDTMLMELLFAVHNLRLAGAKRITAIIPYFGYSRQNRKTLPRVPIAASATAQLLQCMGVDRVLTVDLHCAQIQGFFHNCPVDNLPMHSEFARVIRTRICKDENISVADASQEIVIVSPDANGVARARQLANAVNARAVATILRRQTEISGKMEMVGDVKGLVAVIIDDITDTARTLTTAANLCAARGARSVHALVTHGLLAGNAIDLLNECDALKDLYVTDSVELNGKPKKCPKLHVVSIAPMIAEAIERTHSEVSLSAMF
ncbi:Ribose-phosphate pyrophosphokinase [Diplonema papillatum]|nr:Ribose-phosphate pyrophosphokinase [Diplonema papillatum]